jgi:hypothetical protein
MQETRHPFSTRIDSESTTYCLPFAEGSGLLSELRHSKTEGRHDRLYSSREYRRSFGPEPKDKKAFSTTIMGTAEGILAYIVGFGIERLGVGCMPFGPENHCFRLPRKLTLQVIAP